MTEGPNDTREDGASDANGGAATGPVTREDAASPERVDRLARRLDAAGEPYVRVTVVRREPPVSARVGDRAILTRDGDLVGWVGGAECAQSVVRREATRALETGDPVLVGLAPDPESIARPGLESFPMTCHSGGTLELFVEPVRPAPRLVVVGDSPVARTLVRLASELAYDVTAVAGTDEGDGADPASAFGNGVEVVASADADALTDAVRGAAAVVVATMGAFDATALDVAVDAEAPYVGLVASRARADDLFAGVAERTGRDPDAVRDRVTVPAGLDIGAETPGEIAVSVLAELVAVARGGRGGRGGGGATRADADEPADRGRGDAGGTDHSDDDPAGTDGETEVDPVCGMTVVVGEAAATVEHDGETYHFCAQGCADAFAVDPGRFVGPDAEAR